MVLLNMFRSYPKIKTIAAGEALFRTGEKADFMYVLMSGTAEILVGEVVVEETEPGTIVGEMAMIDGVPRSATVIAKTECTFAVIFEQDFHVLIFENPQFAREVIRVMARRLRRSDRSIEALQKN